MSHFQSMTVLEMIVDCVGLCKFLELNGAVDDRPTGLLILRN